MPRKILMLLLPILALVAGSMGGAMLRPAPEIAADAESAAAAAAPAASPAWMGFANQFFVPVMRAGDMKALMILTLTIETDEDQLERLQKQEHRLRDALLRRLMIEANTGGFEGNFTTEPFLRGLREALLEAARAATDDSVHAVLIEDIARQQQ